MGLYTGVEDVAIIGVPNEEMGEEVKAVVVLSEGYSPSPEFAQDIINYAKSEIAHYKCPRSVDFVDDLPRFETGKLAKRILYELYWDKE